MQPDLDAVARQHEQSVDLVVVDATQDLEQARSLGVRGTPTLIAVNNGAEISRFTGRRSRSELAELFAAVAAGDTSEVAATSRADRIVWSVAGVLLAGAGWLSGPSWVLVAIGAGLVGLALIRSVGGHVRV